jgi:hypothetical protein
MKRGEKMALGGLMLGLGIVWVLQGIRVLPATFMDGSAIWAILGACSGIGGVTILAGSSRSGAL